MSEVPDLGQSFWAVFECFGLLWGAGHDHSSTGPGSVDRAIVVVIVL